MLDAQLAYLVRYFRIAVEESFNIFHVLDRIMITIIDHRFYGIQRTVCIEDVSGVQDPLLDPEKASPSFLISHGLHGSWSVTPFFGH